MLSNLRRRLASTRMCDYEMPLGEDAVRNILRRMDLDPDKKYNDVRLLDFGCGGGRYLEGFARHFGRENVVGVEVVPERIDQVRSKGLQVELLDVDKAHLPFDDASFEIVFSSNVIEHIPHDLYKQYLEEVNRVLAPGGMFFVGMPNYPIKRFYDMFTAVKPKNRSLFLYYLLDDPTHINKMSIFQLERDLSEHFTDVQLEPSYILWQRWIRPLRRNKKFRHRLRGLGYKLSGRCRKPLNHEA